MSFGDVAASAIRFARDGFPTYPFFAEILAAKQAEIRQWPTHRGDLSAERTPARGRRDLRADRSRPHAAIHGGSGDGACARGDRSAGLRAAHDAFYRGDIAGAIVRHQRENGGWLTADDLAEFRSRVEPPCRIRFGDFDVYGCGAVVAGADGAGGAEYPGRPRSEVDAAQFGRLRPRRDRGAETRRGGSRGLFRRSGFRRRAARCVAVEGLRGTPARLDSIRRRRGPACRRRAKLAACRSRPGAPIRPPVRRWRLPTPSRRHRFCVSPIDMATCSPPRRATRRLAGRSCRAPASCRRCGVRAATPGGPSCACRPRAASAHVGQSGDCDQAR